MLYLLLWSASLFFVEVSHAWSSLSGSEGPVGSEVPEGRSQDEGP